MSRAGRIACFVYGTTCYLLFLATFAYSIGFLGNLLVPKSIDTGTEGSLLMSIVINLALLSVFAVQHSVMARPAFKQWWTRIIPQPVERSTYVLLTCAALALLYWQWQPLTSVVWDLQASALGPFLTGIYFAGWGLVLYATLLIDHFDLFGMRQVVLELRERKYTHHPFRTPSLYLYMRHPLYLGWFIVFWVTPLMTAGHLLFAAVASGYILVAVLFEERDLVAHFGDAYRRYQETTPKFFPLPWRKPAAGAAAPAQQG